MDQLKNQIGYNEIDDLGMLNYGDFKNGITGSSIILCRKMEGVDQFIDNGGTLNASTSMRDVINFLKQAEKSVDNSANGTNITRIESGRGAPKLCVNPLEPVDGQPIKYEKWEKGLRETIGQTVYSPLLDLPPTTGDTIIEARDKELHFMLAKALLDGSGMHILSPLPKESGHLAIKEIQEWYGSAAT